MQNQQTQSVYYLVQPAIAQRNRLAESSKLPYPAETEQQIRLIDDWIQNIYFRDISLDDCFRPQI